MADGTVALTLQAQAGANGEAIGQVSSFSGDATIVRADGSEAKAAEGSEIFQGDVVHTGPFSGISMVFADETAFSLGEESEMAIDEMVYDPDGESGSAVFSIAKGVFGFVSGHLTKVDPDAMVIDTPSAVIGIRGSSGTGRVAPEGQESTFILVPDPDGTVGEIIIHTETGSVVMNVPYQASAVLSAFISPSTPVVLPASVVMRVFGNTVEALSQARADAGVQDGPLAAAASSEAPSAAELDSAGAGELGAEIAQAGGEDLDAALAEATAEAEAAAAALAAEQSALEAAAAAAPGAESEAAAVAAFDQTLAGGGSLADAFRAAVEASEQKGAEAERQAEEERAESAELFGDSVDRDLDDLFIQLREAQSRGRSAAETAEAASRGQPIGDAQEAVEEALTQDLNDLVRGQAPAQPEDGFVRGAGEQDGAAGGGEEEDTAPVNITPVNANAGNTAPGNTAPAAVAPPPPPPPPPLRIDGTAGDDSLTGGAGDDTISGAAGDDTITGAGGADTMTGGRDDDTFAFNTGDAAAGETVDGGGGTDKLLVNAGQNVDFRAAAVSRVEELEFTGGAGSAARLNASQFAAIRELTFNGAAPAEVIIDADAAGGALDLSGATISGPARDQAVFTVNGAAGDDTITGTWFDDTINGGDGDDIINGLDGVDTLNGGAGDDTFIIADQPHIEPGDAFDGGAGTDTLQITTPFHMDLRAVTINSIEKVEFANAGSSAGVSFLVSQLTQVDEIIFRGTNARSFNFHMEAGEDNLDMTAFAARVNFSGAGAAAAEFWIHGTAADNTITGSGQKDVITAGAGADTITGGAGDDTFIFTAGDAPAGESIDGGAGTDTLQINGGQNVDFRAAAVSGVEKLEFIGGAGAGAHFMESQLAGITEFAYKGSDPVTLSIDMDAAGAFDLQAFLAAKTLSGGAAGQAVFTVTGTAGADTITGSARDDTIIGGAGADNLNGAGGDDTFIYNNGDAAAGETLDGGAGNDTVQVSGVNDFTGGTMTGIEAMELKGGGAEVTVDSSYTGTFRFEAGVKQIFMIDYGSVEFDLSADANLQERGYQDGFHQYGGITNSAAGSDLYIEGDARDNIITVTGPGNSDISGYSGNDVITGGSGEDFISGGDDDDTLRGNAGADTITGGAGADDMDGGAGDDTFVFRNGDVTAGEKIEGGAGTDKIQVSARNDVDFRGASISGVEEMSMDFGNNEASLTADQVSGIGRFSIQGPTSSATLKIDLDGAAGLDLSGVAYVGAVGARFTNIIEGGTAARETITGSRQSDRIIASEGGDIIDLRVDGRVDELKITSWDEFAMSVSNFNTANDKFILNAGDLTDNAGNADSAVNTGNFRTITGAGTGGGGGGGGGARDLTRGTDDGSIFEFTNRSTWLQSGTDASNAVTRAEFMLGAGGRYELTVHSGAENIFIIYENGGGAAVFYFENADGDSKVDRGELKLLAYLDGVVQGGLSESNFEFATDPLVFDLDGDGVTLTAAPVSFDTDGDGQNDATAWFDSDDAMLVIDENADGVINSMKEVVSSYLTYGGGVAAGKSSLDALAQFDDNGDGVIDSADAVFSVLKLWNDADGDGVTDAGELLTLADYGITRIGLNGETVNEETAGGTIHRTAEAEKADGDKITVAEVSFNPAAAANQDDDSDPTAGTTAA